jgi:hypothetical protein
MPKRKPRKAIRRRPVPKWKLIDSILYIKARDKYLQDEGILRQIGERRWRFRPKINK